MNALQAVQAAGNAAAPVTGTALGCGAHSSAHAQAEQQGLLPGRKSGEAAAGLGVEYQLPAACKPVAAAAALPPRGAAVASGAAVAPPAGSAVAAAAMPGAADPAAPLMARWQAQ